MRGWIAAFLFFVSWKTQTPTGSFFWTAEHEGFQEFYQAANFAESLFINPTIKQIRIDWRKP